MSYPQPRWPPPSAAPIYAGPGARPWIPYGVPPPHPFASYPHSDRLPGPPKDEYWATELKENPLGLENMHIRAESAQKEINVAGSSSTAARAPTSYSRASDYAVRNSYPPNSTTRASLAPSRSHPNTRVPSPAQPGHLGWDRELDRNAAVSNARCAAYSATEAHNRSDDSQQLPSMYTRPPSRVHVGRTSVTAEAGERYSSASAAHATQMSSRTQTGPGEKGRRHTGAPMPEAAFSQAQEMHRSKTLPGDMLRANLRQDRSMVEQVPRRSSDRYDYHHPQDDYESEGKDEDPALSGWQHVGVDEATEKDTRKEKRTMDRVRAWATNVRRLGSSQHDRDDVQVRERERRATLEERSRSGPYNPPHEARDEIDGYGNDRMYDIHDASAAQYARERERARTTRHTSAPDTVLDLTSRIGQEQDGRYGDMGSLTIAEEPKDMYGHNQNHQQSVSASRPQHSRAFESPRNTRERDWAYREDSYSSGSSSGSTSDDESEQDHDRSLGRMGSMRGRDHRAVGTPHPAAPRRLTERNDTLQVDDGTGNFTLTQGKAHLPSPRSLRQSSRTPSSRPSYERVQAEREQELQRSKTNGFLMAGTSSASGAAAAGFGYGTPPVTPTRQDQAHRSVNCRSPYPPQPTASGSALATIGTEPVPVFHAPTRLAHLYRESSVSPSPASHRAESTRPQQQNSLLHSHQQLQSGQYSMSGYNPAEEARPRKRSPHASRSPSPLPSGQGTSSSSAYYAALGERTSTPSRANSRSRGPSLGYVHGQSHAYSHSLGHARHSGNQTDIPPSRVEYDGHRRSSSRTAVLAGSGYSSASGAAAAASHSAVTRGTSGNARHVRAGYWNRRGDHLIETRYVVYCPPGRCYPADLADYPDTAFKNHLGNVVKATPDQFQELPESVPKCAGRAPEKAYDSFVKYVLVSSTS